MPTLSIERRTAAPQPVLFVRLTASREQLAQKIGEGLGRSCGYVQASGLAMAGPPYVRYTATTAGVMTIEAGAPLAQPAPGVGDIEAGELPGGPVVVALHGGSYDDLHATHSEVERWMAQQGLQRAGAPWESYVTDPGAHPNPLDWRTEVYWPVSQSD